MFIVVGSYAVLFLPFTLQLKKRKAGRDVLFLQRVHKFANDGLAVVRNCNHANLAAVIHEEGLAPASLGGMIHSGWAIDPELRPRLRTAATLHER